MKKDCKSGLVKYEVLYAVQIFMKLKIKSDLSGTWVCLPKGIFENLDELEAARLGEKVFLLMPAEDAKNIFSQNGSMQGGEYSGSYASELGKEELAIISKLARIPFAKRTQENVLNSLNDAEKQILKTLLLQKAIGIFKNSRYPQGVYSIPNKIYFPSRGLGEKKQVPKFSHPSKLAGPALAINTFEHLAALGYMVLSNEGEAKQMMPIIKEKLKGDDVKGVRGFDKNYYVLRKSFMREYEKAVFSLLEEGFGSPDEIGPKLNITREAAMVILMVMADEGEAIEKRRGTFARA
ncbi:hypothetical protein COU37_01650 [Candidatus Micrarchaeota archaeon CG10_big_fil_rev_8_21_14_0_10_45_29]|nr:MAG: hypothetical protein COU37_01650 [Candidatus Micrarchaeota archaeon CG10_big_fil_rev_8_21_14_0_10_45_29]